MTNSILKGEEILNLIPQRSPIIMIDTFYYANETDSDSALTITENNFFCENNHFTEPGLIEHIAQSAAAFAGYPYYKKGQAAPLGYIGEIKKLKINFLPKVNDEIKTHIHIISEVMGITLILAETKLNEQIIVSCQLKISIDDNN